MRRFGALVGLLLFACSVEPGGSGDTSTPASDAPLETEEADVSTSGTMGDDCATAACADDEYCVSVESGASAGSELGSATCEVLPAACAGDATCACLIAEGTCAECTDDADSARPWCID